MGSCNDAKKDRRLVTGKIKEVELEADAWQRFERAVKAVAKARPQHRSAQNAKAKKPARTKTRPKRSG